MGRHTILMSVLFLLDFGNIASAEMIQGINMDFVPIGNACNIADYTNRGAVDYEFSIGKYEVTNAQWYTFISLVGAPTGNLSNAYDQSSYWTGANVPTTNVSWYEAAQFCNFLTSGDKSLGAYIFNNTGDFLGVDRAMAQAIYGSIYVLPTEHEWYKAAYYTGSSYSLYANGLDTILLADNGWNYIGGSYNEPWDVGTGTQEQNGTFDMMGNVYEWMESPWSLGESNRVVRGGVYNDSFELLSSYNQYRLSIVPDYEASSVGFRVVEVIPVPGSFILCSIGLGFSSWKLGRSTRRAIGL